MQNAMLKSRRQRELEGKARIKGESDIGGKGVQLLEDDFTAKHGTEGEQQAMAAALQSPLALRARQFRRPGARHVTLALHAHLETW